MADSEPTDGESTEGEPKEDEEVEAPEEDGQTTAAAELLYGCPVSYSRDQRVIHVERQNWRETAIQLLADGWAMCVDVTAVDYSAYQAARNLPVGVAAERFEVVASFISHSRRERIRARAQVPADDPTIDSLYEIYPGTDYLEREVFDLFGITFEGHPDMSRILMPESWDGHPLRKDYAVGAIPVQFKAPSD